MLIFFLVKINKYRISYDVSIYIFIYLETGPFIDRLFKELGYESNDKQQSDSQPERSRRLSDYSDEEDDGDRNFKHRRPRSEARDDSRYSRSSADDRHQYKRHLPHDNYNRHSRNNNDDYRTGANSVPRAPASMYDHRQQQQQQQEHRGSGPSGGSRSGYRNNMGSGRPTRPLCRDYNGK